MTVRESYDPGTFSWVELVTSDGPGAKAFYESLFGWEYEDSPIGEESVYTTAKLDGHSVAGMFQSDRPVAWASYVTVASADETAASVAGLGGTLISEPFDVMDVGRMAVVQDPQGAVFCIWEPRRHIGAGLVNSRGALTWNELHTTDREDAIRFYGGLFGWEFQAFGDEYHTIRNGTAGNGGMIALEPGGSPYWLAYFASDHLGSMIEAGTGAGGTLLVPATPGGGNGEFAVLTDPQGAAFGLYAGEFDA